MQTIENKQTKKVRLKKLIYLKQELKSLNIYKYKF